MMEVVFKPLQHVNNGNNQFTETPH